MTYCEYCRRDTETDTIPADLKGSIPAFTICTHCGVWLDEQESA